MFARGQGCQIFLGTTNPNWKKYTKLSQNIPNEAFHNIPTQIGIFGL
jgi:hypothetical protein